MIRQISVFIQNGEGRLAHVLRALAAKDINIRSLTISETADYGIMRLILQQPDEGLKALKDAHVMCNETDVFAAELPDKPGAMYQLTDMLTRADVGIKYAYSFLPQNTSNAIIIFSTSEDDRPKVIEAIKENPAIRLLDNDKLLMR